MKMMLSFLVCLLVASLPNASGSSTLVANVNSASCTGNLTISLVSATCGGRCTFGSEVYLIGQVTALSDFPQQAKLSVKPTFSHMPSTGVFSVSTAEVDDICSYDYASLTPPAGNDAGYSCPDAGLYNFHVNYDLWGSPDSWYATTYGYSMGVSLHIYDTLNDIEFASCYVEVVAKKGSEDYTWTSAALFFPAAVGVTGLTAGYMMRKRRVGLIDLEKEETSSNFELIDDPSTGV